MQIPRSSPFGIRSPDSPLNGGMFCTPQGSAPSPPHTLNIKVENTMPTLSNHQSCAVSEYCYGLNNHCDQDLTTPKAFPSWHDLQTASTFYQPLQMDTENYQYSKKDVEHTFDNGASGAPVERSLWDFGSQQILSAQPFGQSGPRSGYYTLRNNFNRTDSNPLPSPGPPHNNVSSPTSPPSMDHTPSPRIHVQSDMIPSAIDNQRHLGLIGSSFSFQDHSRPAISTPYLQNLEMLSKKTVAVGERDDKSRLSVINGDESDGAGSISSEPYAQLIFRALKSAPGHRMVLKDIYEWFAHHTDKANNGSSSKGWQNSIRHNLSMNGV